MMKYATQFSNDGMLWKKWKLFKRSIKMSIDITDKINTKNFTVPHTCKRLMILIFNDGNSVLGAY